MSEYIDIDIYFDDVNFTELFEVYLAERPPIIVAEKVYETIQVPERMEGSLTREVGYKSKPMLLKFRFVDGVNEKQKVREIVNWIQTKRKIHFSDDPDVYRVIQQINFSDMPNEMKGKVDFVLLLETEPFWYQDAGTQNIGINTVINNPSEIPVAAKFRVYGNGLLEVNFNGKLIRFFTVDGYIDVEDKNAFKDGIIKNNDMQGDFPILKPGDNVISRGMNVTTLQLDLRWAFR